MFGDKQWSDISEHIFNKHISDTQCMERYTNILDPRVSHGTWTEEQDQTLKKLIADLEFKKIKWT
jgi:hypothetical protein